jgi:diacylglycerol O-acyltransferase / wax synthase
MVKPRRLDRLTASDLWMLWADDFGWSEDIGVLAILDGAGLRGNAGRFRIEAVRRAIEPKLHLVPRFRQLLYRPRRGLGWPLWVDAPSFGLTDHVRAWPLPAPGDEAQLLAACAELWRRRLDPSRPRWEAWLLPGLPADRVGLLLRAHHAMVDGVAGVAAFAALLDGTAGAPVPAVPPWTPAPLPSAGELLADNLRRRLRGLRRGLSGLTQASNGGRPVAATAGALLLKRRISRRP